jgi:uncharacterized protein YbjQ (UPF0145 family)
MRTCAHWLSINIGVDVWIGGELVRAGHALKTLPALHAAFADGRLSFDKIRAVTKVATPADDELWLEIALQASGGQLARICRDVRRALEADDPRRAGDALLNRGLRLWWRDDGMLEVLAVLPKEEGAIVVAAIEAAAHLIATEERHVPSPDRLELAAEHKTHPMLRADALVRLCETWVNAAAQTPAVAPTTQVVVHVDEAVLKGAATGGRSRIEDGPWLPLAAMRRLSCDSDVVTITERDGLPIDVGRVRRLITPRLRPCRVATKAAGFPDARCRRRASTAITCSTGLTGDGPTSPISSPSVGSTTGVITRGSSGSDATDPATSPSRRRMGNRWCRMLRNRRSATSRSREGEIPRWRVRATAAPPLSTSTPYRRWRTRACMYAPPKAFRIGYEERLTRPSRHPNLGGHPMLISTANDLPGYQITEVLGEVFGLTVRSRNIGSQFGAGLKSLMGGELKGMTANLAQSRQEVIERMVGEAQAKGGNAIVAMRFDTSEMGGTWTEICAYGTAVIANRTAPPMPPA